jgi:hypothetical protein
MFSPEFNVRALYSEDCLALIRWYLHLARITDGYIFCSIDGITMTMLCDSLKQFNVSLSRYRPKLAMHLQEEGADINVYGTQWYDITILNDI